MAAPFAAQAATDTDQTLLASHILQRLGEGGQPPEWGVRRINVGNDSYLKVLEHEYFGRQLKIGASFKLVQGYFGAGKTHFLHCVRELAWERGFATALVALSPTECPYDDSLKVYRAVARHISLRPAEPLASPSQGIADVVRTVVEDALDRAEDAARNRGAADPLTQAQSEVQRWLTRTVGRAACESHSYRRAVVALGEATLADDHKASNTLEAWLGGEAVPAAVMRELGVYETLGKANGFTMLRCLTQMVVALGLPGTALLFDEVDRNLSVSAKRSHTIGDNLRQVIDLCGRHQLPRTLFMYAVPPEFLRQVVPEYPALEQRLKVPVPLSVRSPQSVLIDLERLDLAPEELLQQVGERIVGVFEDARGVQLDHAVQRASAEVLAKAAAKAFFEVNHRRLFVKTWVDWLHRQLVDGEQPLSDADANALLMGTAGAASAALPVGPASTGSPSSSSYAADDGDDFEDF